MTFRPAILLVLDGWGWREGGEDNAVARAETPAFDQIWSTCPHALLRASGADVGLPDGQMGNSEVGHLNLGAGRILMQDLPLIDAAVADGTLGQLPRLRAFIDAVAAGSGTAHLCGLVSDGGVHSHLSHAVALGRLLRAAGLRVVLHVWLDGRDTAPGSARGFLARLMQGMPADILIGSVAGRFFAMDRDRRWERTQQALAAMLHMGAPITTDPLGLVAESLARGVSDEFVPPHAISGAPPLGDGDGLVCFNFRSDRVRQLLDALLDPAFRPIALERRPVLADALGMTRYSEALGARMGVLFPPPSREGFLGAVVAGAGRRQLRVAETEKYPHVTYFLNGGIETPFAGEDRVMIPSPKVATYDLQPEMSAAGVAEAAVGAIAAGAHDLVVVNLANPDMVGHTGSLPAAIRAVEATDRALATIARAAEAADGVLLITADHGNAEQMVDPATGGPHTAHTTNPVPIALLGSRASGLRDGRLADVAPTILALMGLPPAPQMTGTSLIVGNAR